MPLERDAARGNELFLRLPPPHSNIIITPSRSADSASQIENLNDWKVTKWLRGPPYPYTEKDSEEWLAKVVKECAEAAICYEQFADGRRSQPLDSSPIRVIREEDPITGTQKFLGDVNIHRATYIEVVDAEQRAKLLRLNDSLEPGNPALVWEFGNFLASSHHGRGIMSAAVGAFIKELAVPLMNTHIIQASHFLENIGSKRVFEKNGFVPVENIRDVFRADESKGGEMVSLGLLRWERPAEE